MKEETSKAIRTKRGCKNTNERGKNATERVKREKKDKLRVCKTHSTLACTDGCTTRRKKEGKSANCESNKGKNEQLHATALLRNDRRYGHILY